MTRGKNKSIEVDCNNHTPVITPEKSPKSTFLMLSEMQSVAITGKRDI